VVQKNEDMSKELDRINATITTQQKKLTFFKESINNAKEFKLLASSEYHNLATLFKSVIEDYNVTIDNYKQSIVCLRDKLNGNISDTGDEPISTVEFSTIEICP